MAASFLLKPNINLNPFAKQYPLITQLSHNIPLLPISPNFPRLITNPRLTLKCSVTNKKPVLELAKSETIRNPYEIVANALLKALKPLQELTFSAILFVVLALLYFPKSALAASGGCMGGSDFSSSSSSSGGYSSSYDYSYSSSNDSSPSDYSSRSNYSSPSNNNSSLSNDSSPSNDSSLSNDSSPSNDSSSAITREVSNVEAVVTTLILIAFIILLFKIFLPDTRRSVIKLQVGLLGSARSLQKDLNRIAETADTSKKQGLTYILTETTRAILQHPDYCISAYSSVDVKSNMENLEKRFKRISVEERGKFDEETLVNLNNIKKKSTSSKKPTRVNNEYIVITILVAAEGVQKLPKISNRKHLKEALEKLGSIPTNNTLGVEVLWTPQKENDTLTKRDLLKDYPLLRLF